VCQSLLVSLQSFSEGKEKMAKGGRHGMLMMRVARHNGLPVFFGSFEKGLDQPDQAIAEI